MKQQHLLLKLVGSLTMVMILGRIAYPLKAQEFYHFPASFFNPVANFYESEDNLDVVNMLERNDDFEIITFLLKNDPTLTSLQQQEVTFLAPKDEAFKALPSDVRAKLLQPEHLAQLLQYHTIARKIQDSDIQNKEVKTLSGDAITITGFPVGNNFGVKLNEAIASDPLPASNGVIVPLDRVLLPPGF